MSNPKVTITGLYL
ncbi:hypothetical protein Anas_13902 [Armadillidium nasatum]|uniref:Uncharacterized protein n=1 Tax=Armadillidium nasatum TaxID=96803 RepID=A0A5N5TCU9_9CRUS|nr:hypothetical protein Anas_13902 [Armadillidium nasatum]